MLLLLSLLIVSFHQVHAEFKLGAADAADDHYFHFVTRPDIGAPKWNIEVYDADALAQGYWFVAPYASLDQTTFPHWNGPHIYDQNGDLIWSGAPFFKHYNTFDFRVTHVNGQPMMSLVVPHDLPGPNGRKINHISFPGHGTGDGVILDDSYNIYRTIDMRGDISNPNMHDLTIMDNGKRALMLTQKTYKPTTVRIGKVNKPCKIGWQGLRETELETGKVVFEWDAQHHIDPFESTKHEAPYRVMCQDIWDILHFNSVDKFDDGDYLLSARHTNTIYKVSHEDGSIVWRLGGLKSDFEFIDEAAKFTRQHHAKIHSQNETHTLVSLFNNAKGSGHGEGEQPSSEESSALLLALRTDVTPMTAELVRRYGHPDGKISPSRGSLSFLDNGNAFVGWVFESLISEHTFDGKLLMQARLRHGENTYRAYKFPWIGRPSQPPDVHSMTMKNEQQRLTTLVHVSWNGATEVTSWTLLHTNAEGNVFETIVSTPRQGFETALSYDGFAKYIVVVALDRNGEEIGRSKTIRTIFPSDKDATSLAVAEEAQWLQHHSFSSDTSSSTPELPAPSSSSPASKLDLQSTTTASYGWLGLASIAFALGFTCCILVGALMWLILGAGKRSTLKTAWWRSSSQAYNPLPDNEEDDVEEDGQTSNEKAVT
jgi:hypothetical protein